MRALRTWQRSCPGSVKGIGEAIIGFAEEILTDDRQDVADTLQRLQVAACIQALEAHHTTV
ncbi:hypothetical protein [Streptomyces capparidis]